MAVFFNCTSTDRVGLSFLWLYVQELPKAQPAEVLVLNRLRRWGNGLKSLPTDWEKPGIELSTPCLQDIGLSHTPRRLLWSFFIYMINGNIKHISIMNLYPFSTIYLNVIFIYMLKGNIKHISIKNQYLYSTIYSNVRGSMYFPKNQ